MFKVIIYDDKTMTAFSTKMLGLDMSPEEVMQVQSFDDNTRKLIITGYRAIIETCNLKGEIVKLDPSTMKRIAKYNKTKEIQKIQEKIDEKKEELEYLEEQIEDRVKRIKKIEELVENVYLLDLDKDYFKDEDEDYDDEYWEE